MPKTAAENIAAAAHLKEEGNARFKASDHKNARKCYAKMNMYLRHLDAQAGKGVGGGGMEGMGKMLGGGAANPADSLTEEQKVEVATLTNAMNSNLSNCYLKLEKPELVVKYASLVLERDPDNKKILFRRGKGQYLVNALDLAKSDLEKCDPKDKEVRQLLQAIAKKEKKANEKQKKRLAGMFDKLAEDEQ